MGKSSTPQLIPISVAQHEHNTVIVYKEIGDVFSLRIATSSDGVQFKLHPTPVTVSNGSKNEKIGDCMNIRLSVVADEYVLSYERKSGTTRTGLKKEVVFAHSADLKKFKVHKDPAHSKDINHSGFIVDIGHHVATKKTTAKSEYALYYGSPTITAAQSTNLDVWKTNGALLLSPRGGFFDHGHLGIIAAHSITEGIAVLYQTRSYENGKEQLLIGGALFAHDNPYKIIWRAEAPMWEHEFDKSDTAEAAWTACGAIFKKDSVYIYLASKDGDLSVVAIPNRFHMLSVKKPKPPEHITRHTANPIIEPVPHHEWQSQATFNPAALEVDGRIHLLYRAMGPDGISRVGHSSSADGVNFDKRSTHPVFEPSAGFGLPADGEFNPNESNGVRRYDPIFNASGGGWAGCEDPRAVQIGKRIYVTYVAFEGWNSVRIALTSILVSDFKKEKWNWRVPELISPPGQVHKNWVIFPEKINGKYAILHGISPRIRVDYVDKLSDLGDTKKMHIESAAPSGGRRYHWDNKVRGAGPPPIKTRLGWLVLYHATDILDLNKYKIGAMILDLTDPTQILYRSPEPILTPEMPYENDWKPGVIYASGAIIHNDNLMVYYGGGDKNVCLAETPLEKMLEWLVKYGKVTEHEATSPQLTKI